MSGIKPEQFDYNAAVDKADKEGFDWMGLYKATEDPGFATLSEQQRKHVWDLLRVKSERTHGNRVDPYEATGEASALSQLGNAIKTVVSSMIPTQPGVFQEHIQAMNKNQELATTALVNKGYSDAQAEQLRKVELQQASEHVIQQFGYYFTGGLIPEPEQNEDVYAQEMMDKYVKPATSIVAIGSQFAMGSALLGLVSKVPLVSGAAENLSIFTRGMIKGALLDFGINAAWPEGLSTENRLGISDNISRMIAPQSVMENPAGPAGRIIAGVGGAAEGALFGSLIYGFGAGVKLADAKYAFSASPEMMERVKKSLEMQGVDVTGMTRKDVMLTYRQRMTQHTQSNAEAAFNGERHSAETWIAQQFLSDPNITELTPAEGRLLYGVFATNKGGVSLIKGVTDPEAAIQKLRKVGIDVEATVLTRPDVNTAGVSNGDVLVPASDAELDAAVELAPEVGAKNAQTSGISLETTRKALVPEVHNVVDDIRAAGQDAQKVTDMLKKRFPTLTGNQPAALADGLIQNQEWAVKKLEELRSTPPEIGTVKTKRVRPSKAQLKAIEQRAIKAERRADEVERKAQIDGLTGLHNQGSWKASHPRVDADPGLEVVSTDLSGFKKVNDEVGHTAGDLLLQAKARSIQQAVKTVNGEQAFRIGGDEFAMTVPKGEGNTALAVAQNLFNKEVARMQKEGLLKNLSVIPEIRGGVGNTYKEADAAERALREASREPTVVATGNKVLSDAAKDRMKTDRAFSMPALAVKWRKLSPQQRVEFFGVSDIEARLYKNFSEVPIERSIDLINGMIARATP